VCFIGIFHFQLPLSQQIFKFIYKLNHFKGLQAQFG
jgi:hypothetical protein